MSWNGINVVDCDGHIVESIPEMAEYMDPGIRHVAVASGRQRTGVFPNLDAIHYPNALESTGSVPGPGGQLLKEAEAPVRASDYRTGSGEDVQAFLEKADLNNSVLFPSEGLSVGFIQVTNYATTITWPTGSGRLAIESNRLRSSLCKTHRQLPQSCAVQYGISIYPERCCRLQVYLYT